MENGAARGKAGGYDWTSLTKGGSLQVHKVNGAKVNFDLGGIIFDF